MLGLNGKMRKMKENSSMNLGRKFPRDSGDKTNPTA